MTKHGWSYETGEGRARVVVFANADRDGTLTLRWWGGKNWKSSSLQRKVDVDRRGRITSRDNADEDVAAWAIAKAQEKSLEIAGQRPVGRAAPERKPLTIGEAEALITNKETGKYPHPGQFRDELSRALRFACAVWGSDTPLTAIEESHYIMLLRRRLEGLLAAQRRGVRATEITVSRIITTVRWLRNAKHVPRDAAQWPEHWKEEIVRHWKGITKSSRDPEPQRPRHTLDEAHAILKASDFDPRFELLMWLGMDLRLGQVARARRADLTLTEGDALAAGDYGTFIVYGAGKKGGTIVALTKGQRAAIDRAMGDGGYLHKLETAHQKDAEDYLLFPAGYVAGRVARTRGRLETPLVLGEKVDYTRHVESSWIRKSFRIAEKRAGVEHETGRGAYGLRRVSVDVGAAEELSPSALEALGGWRDTKIPMSIYRDRQNKAGQLEARPVRAKIRGESDDDPDPRLRPQDTDFADIVSDAKQERRPPAVEPEE